METKRTPHKFYQQYRLALAVFFFVVSLVTINSIASFSAHAAPVVGFNPGNIIDNTVFTNANSMSVAQIQTFLNSKVPTCETEHTAGYGQNPPFICLKDYSENGRSAAQIIYDTAQQYQINPQVLIVLLQKEQSLVTDTWPLNAQYKSATGYGCPDTAPCDSQYYGLTNQLKWSGTMFRAILNNSSTWYTPYVLGNNTIYFNPGPYDNANNRYFGQYGNQGDITYCGSTVVNIQNRSTQALYNYTPYQPNQASLDAGYGSAPPCGAYGNRNFFLYFTDWFGPTTRNLITTVGSGVYQVENGTKRAFPNQITFLSYGYKWSDVLPVSNQEFNQFTDGTAMPYNVHYRDGHLVGSSSGGIYVIDNGTKRPFPNEATFFSYGYTYSDALVIDTDELALIPDGTAMLYNTHRRDGYLVTSQGGGIYVIDNGTKRPFPNEATFFSYGYKFSDALAISGGEMSLIPDGTAMPYNVHYRDGHLVGSSSGGIYVIDNGTKRPFPNEATFFSYGYKFSDALPVSTTELGLIPDGAPMPPKA